MKMTGKYIHMFFILVLFIDCKQTKESSIGNRVDSSHSNSTFSKFTNKDCITKRDSSQLIMFIEEFKEYVERKDKSKIIEMIDFPLEENISGQEFSKQDFEDNFNPYYEDYLSFFKKYSDIEFYHTDDGCYQCIVSYIYNAKEGEVSEIVDLSVFYIIEKIQGEFRITGVEKCC